MPDGEAGFEPDDDLPLFSRHEAARFRRLVAETMGGLGREVVVTGQAVEGADGQVFGLSNLSAVAAAGPESEWPEIVDRHCRRILALADRSDTGPVQLDGHLVLRLVGVDSLGPDGAQMFSYASEFAPGVVRVLCVDEPEAVRLLGDKQVAQFAPLGPALDLGLRNLSSMIDADPTVPYELEDTVGDHVAHFTVLESDGVYVASYAQCMEQVLHRWAPGVDVSRGVIFSVPFRNVLAFRPVGDAMSILGTIQLMAPFAFAAHGRNAGPVSPHVMLWEPSGAVTPLSSFDGESLRITPGPLERYLRLED